MWRISAIPRWWDIINELLDYGVSVDIVDPHANTAEVKHEYGLDMIQNLFRTSMMLL